MAFLIDTILAPPMGFLMRICLQIFSSYGVAIIFFTFLTKVILFPLSIWTHQNSIKMIKIQPEVNLIKANNINDGQRTIEEQQALYKRVHYKPLAGILPMMIQIPLIMGLMSVINHPLQHILHLDLSTIEQLSSKAAVILNLAGASKVGQLQIVDLVQNQTYAEQFASLNIPEALTAINGLNLHFGTMPLGTVPTLYDAAFWHNGVNLMPLFACASAFLLSWMQNLVNILQKEAGWFNRWGMAIFLSLFSLYFGCVVPSGVALYWIFSNLFAILVMLITYWIIPPSKQIDYKALEESKVILARSKAAEAKAALTPHQKRQAKADYSRFCKVQDMHLVFYSEKSGFYRYFASIINIILAQSDLTIHYITSDPDDAVHRMDNPRIITYFMDEPRLILAFMKLDADMMVMTMTDLEQFHLKRSYIRKDMEYVYLYHGVISGPRTVRKGATQYYDTLLSTGIDCTVLEQRMEQYYGWKPRKMISCGYPLLDQMIEDYRRLETANEKCKKRICIAPSYQPENILDHCLMDLLNALNGHGFDIVIRPHPQYSKLYPARLTKIQEDCRELDSDGIHFETVWGTNDTIYTSDLIITDWSSVGFEFALTTLKPVLFIDTPPKIINPEAKNYDFEKPPEIYLRNQIGKSLLPEQLASKALEVVNYLLAHTSEYMAIIKQTREEHIYNVGHSAEVAAEYIMQTLISKGEQTNE